MFALYHHAYKNATKFSDAEYTKRRQSVFNLAADFSPQLTVSRSRQYRVCS